MTSDAFCVFSCILPVPRNRIKKRRPSSKSEVKPRPLPSISSGDEGAKSPMPKSPVRSQSVSQPSAKRRKVTPLSPVKPNKKNPPTENEKTPAVSVLSFSFPVKSRRQVRHPCCLDLFVLRGRRWTTAKLLANQNGVSRPDTHHKRLFALQVRRRTSSGPKSPAPGTQASPGTGSAVSSPKKELRSPGAQPASSANKPNAESSPEQTEPLRKLVREKQFVQIQFVRAEGK